MIDSLDRFRDGRDDLGGGLGGHGPVSGEAAIDRSA
jgi:hypothetical protein